MAYRTVGLLSRSTEVASPASEAFACELSEVVNTQSLELGLKPWPIE
ncbi:MAG: hypothetical protein JNL61_05075 [Rhizobiaceae bacterium]|nr:hypothetical protein [Rhizobiaceae bacterium]